MISEHTREGLAAARARGRKGGRKPKLVRQREAMRASRSPTCGNEPVDAQTRWQQRQLNAVIDRLAVEGRDAFPVVDEQGTYRGTVTARDVEDSVRANALETTAETLRPRQPRVRRCSHLPPHLRPP